MFDPTQIQNAMSKRDLVRFCEKILVGDKCWDWAGTIREDRYGSFSINGHPHAAHRVSWQLFRGPLPESADVLHRCDNRGCVHPDHLFLGDQAMNMADKTAKGRQSHGSGHGRAKLVEAVVVLMRHEYRRGLVSQAELARRHGVDPAAVRRALLRQTWRHVP